MNNKLFKKFIEFGIGNLIVLITGFISSPIITRLILPEEFGKFSMFNTLTSLFLFILMLGLDQSYIRFFYEEDEEVRGKLLVRVVKISMIVNIILSLIQLMDFSIKEKLTKVEPEEKFKRYIQGIKQNSFRLLRLSNNIIDMTKIDSGLYSLHKTNCNIVNLIDNIVDSISQYVENKGIELIFDPACEEVITACDKDKVQRIILNIISNSIKYIEGKGKILIRLNIENNCVVISVKDNGIGISKENLGTIFEKFKQVDSTFTRKVEGSGIGLSLVKSLVEMHDGDIYIESEEGKGTNVAFYLPIVILDNIDKNEVILGDYLEENRGWKIEFADIYD